MRAPVNTRELFLNTFHREPAFIAAAPGRIEFIGNHTDYNGGVVLGAAIDRGIEVAVAPRTDEIINLKSSTRDHVVSVGLDRLQRLHNENYWANYPLGVLQVLQQEGLDAERGFDLAVTSTLPVGAGLSSSAALELATAYALGALYGHTYTREVLVHVCRRAENEFVGVPCGILDQGVSAYGKENHLVWIDCKDLRFETVPMPSETAFWIFNSHQKHSLISSLYAKRHEECMKATAELAKAYPGVQHLTELSSAQVEAQREALPEELYKRALHVTSENERVGAVKERLAAGDLQAVGAALYRSHESSRTLFENSTPELDFLVEALRGQPHVYGARLTGGGFGGAAMALTTPAFGAAHADAVSRAYRKRFGAMPSVLQCRTAGGARLLAS